MIGQKKIALIHVAKNQVGMSDAEYRALLAGFGASSSKEIKSAQFDAVMRQFRSLGFVPRRNYRKPAESKKRLQAKVMAQITALGITNAYVDAMARRMFGRDSWRWLNADELHRLVAALSIHQKRTGNK